MTTEFEETVARVSGSITRLPDRLTTPRGESSRQEYAHIFAECMAGQLDDQDGLYLSLPFQVSLLTDPIPFIVAGGLLLLDHPTKPEQFDYAISSHAHIVDLNRDYSLYEDRYPRLIAHKTIAVSWMSNQLRRLGFRGPFSKPDQLYKHLGLIK